MSNEPNKAVNAPASNAADQSAKVGTGTKPETTVTPPSPAAAPTEPKKS